MGAPTERFLVEQREAHGIASLPIDEEAVAQLPKLPDLHRDPFDRMLVCQAIAHGLTVVTPMKRSGALPVAFVLVARRRSVTTTTSPLIIDRLNTRSESCDAAPGASSRAATRLPITMARPRGRSFPVSLYSKP